MGIHGISCGSLCSEQTRPLLFGGDFDEILSDDEKEGGVDKVRREVTHFCDVMDDFSLCDLGYNGVWYT